MSTASTVRRCSSAAVGPGDRVAASLVSSPETSSPIAGDTADADPLDAAYELSPNVSIRPEQFGALLYHFGTRRLSFLKDRPLLALVQALATSDSVRHACERAGIASVDQARYARSLQTLLDTDMIRPRPQEQP